MFILDNECSTDIKNAIKNYNANFQLVPPHQHRRNAAEKAIKTVKNHLLSGLATCHKNFPITEWDRILPQAEITLNLMRNCRIQPHLSAWAYLNESYDFTKNPMAPPGSKILIHQKPANRASWAFHGIQGWYIGPTLQHYRCVRCYVPSTRSEVISDTIKFIPDYIPIPSATIEDYIKAAMEQTIAAIKTQKLKNNKSSNNITPITSYVQVSNLLNNNPIVKSNNTIQNYTNNTNICDQKIKQSEYQQPLLKKKMEHNIKYKKPQITPLSDEEFENLLKNLRKPKNTSEGETLRQKNTNTDLFINHMYDDNTGKKQSLDTLLKKNPTIWGTALSNELGRLAQGVRDIEGNNVLDFIPYKEVPQDRIVTYSNMVCDIRPLKAEKFRVRLTVGGDRLQYPDDTASPAATLLETKLLLNSTISQSAQGARFMTLDIKDFFLQTVMDRPEYMKIHSRYFLNDIREKYNIRTKIHKDGYVILQN